MKRIKERLRQLFTVNPGLKLLALLMAGFTFHAIRGVTSEEEVYLAPVHVQTPNPATAVINQEPHSVSVTVRGSREEIGQVDPHALRVWLKPRSLEVRSLTIRRRDIQGLGGLHIVKIDPDRVAFSFTRIREPNLDAEGAEEE